MSYQPHAGSLPSRVCAWFVANPEEELTSGDIGRRWDVPAINVVSTLASCTAAGWLQRVKSDGIYVYRAGPNLPPDHTDRVIPIAAPAAAKAANGARNGTANGTHNGTHNETTHGDAAATPAAIFNVKRPRLPPLDASQFKAVEGVPVPDVYTGKHSSRHDAIFEHMAKPGAAVLGLPIQYRSSMTKALQQYGKRLGRKYQIRANADGRTFGIWRTE